jgi:hypothetical protein
LISHSTYEKDYEKNNENKSPERMHPDNNITLGGPFYNITSYKSGLPGSFGQSPFVFI